jgi:hypothetical protein
MHPETLLVEGERLQMQGLDKGTNITLAIGYGAIGFNLGRLRQLANN